MAFTITITACAPSGPDGDKELFREWSAKPANAASVADLSEFLKAEDVRGVLQIRQLLRNDTEWLLCRAEPFDIPPKRYWPNMVSTLKLIRDEVKPLVGPVEALSVFRGTAINACIGGANRSQHLRFFAIDMRPAKGVSRADLIEKLCALHARKGRTLNMGLGIYKGTRFHIDTAGYRRWGHDHHANSSPCASFVAPQRKKR